MTSPTENDGEKLDREKLVKGSWSAEYPDPDPVPAPIQNELLKDEEKSLREPAAKQPPAQPAPPKRAVNDNADVWLDF